MREQIERHGLPKGHMPKRGKPYEGALNNSPGSDHVPIKQSAGKRPPRSANLNADQRDKIYELERENMDLKQKENYLENNIVIMRTKLRRIEELFSKKKKDQERQSSFSSMPEDLANWCDDEVRKMKAENEHLRDYKKKLAAIERDFIAKAVVVQKKPDNKYGHVRGKLGNKQRKQSEVDYDNLIEELRQQTIKGERQIINLTAQRDQLRRVNPGDNSAAVKLSLEQQSNELNEINIRIAKLSGELARDKVAFDDQKDLIEGKQREVQVLTRELSELSMKQQQADYQQQKAQQLAERLDEVRAERDGLDAQITTLSSQPFFKDRNSSAASIKVQIERLMIQLREETDKQEMREQEERNLESQVTEAKSAIERLKGERDVLQKQHNEAAKKFNAANSDVTTGKLERDLLQMDPEAFAQTYKDIEIQPDQYPLWRKHEFLERKEGDPNSLEWLKKEKQKLLQANKDLAAGLDKVETLLRLQTDIEKENRQYYEAEKARVKLLADSSKLKEEEMQRRLANQDDVLRDIKQQLGLVHPPSMGKDHSPGKPGPSIAPPVFDDKLDNDLELDDTPMASDENILDVKIVSATLNDVLIRQLLSNIAYQPSWDSLNEAFTMVALDFMNHDTRVSPPTQGQHAAYNTQISYINRIDNVYVQQLLQERSHLEVWLYERERKKILLGTADLLLSDLVFQGAHGAHRGPRIEDKKLIIKPNPDLISRLEKAKQPASIGTFHIVAGLRKNISDQARYFSDMAAAKNAALAKKPTDAPRTVNVKINVEKCEGLRVHYQNVAELAPFFYYQFYTFDEFISSDQSGSNPWYRDATTYKIALNNETSQYLTSQQLVISFVDANGPQTGIMRGGHGGEAGDEDFIGKVAIPLRQIAEFKSLPLKAYTIRDNAGRENGQAWVSIEAKEVVPLAATTTTSLAGSNVVKVRTAEEQRRDSVINAIATKLGRKPIEIDVLFGLFSRGQDVCDYEDFKYTCLYRLNLKRESGLDEDDLNHFVETHPRLKNKQLMNQDDFMFIFKEPIMQARKNVADQEARDHSQMLRYQQAMREQQQAGVSFDASMSATSTNMAFSDFQRIEVQRILGTFVLRSSQDEILSEVKKASHNGSRIEPKALDQILKRFCSATEDESNRVVSLVTTNGIIFVDTFAKELIDALLKKREDHEGARKLKVMILTIPQQLANCFLNRDINRDGAVNLDGFKSAMIDAGAVSEYAIPLNGLIEVFKLVSINGNFHYANYMQEIDSRNKQYFTSLTSRAAPDESIAAMESTDFNQSNEFKTVDTNKPDSGKLQQTSVIPVALLQSAIEKVNAFLLSQDLTLSMLFNVIDTNSDSVLSKAEFKHQLSAMHMDLKPEELDALFKKLDADNDGQVTYQEFISQFARVSTMQIISRMQKLLYGANLSIEQLVADHVKNVRIMPAEFRSICKKLIPKLADYEIDNFFKELDRTGQGSLDIDEFVSKFSVLEQERHFQTGIEDILKPLQTQMKVKNMTNEGIFKKYDQNNDKAISAKELAACLKTEMGVVLDKDEIETLHEFFRNKFRRAEINLTQFKSLMTTRFDRLYQASKARSSLKTVEKALRKTGRTPEALFSTQAQFIQDDNKNEVNIRTFKLAIFSMNILTQQEINNLAKYMDRRNNGMIHIREFNTALAGGNYSPNEIKA